MSAHETAASTPAQESQSFQGARVVTMATAHAVHDTYQSFVAPLIPVFIQNLALSKAEAGALDLFLRWPSVLQPVFGYIADRTSLRYLVILAPAITTTLMSFLGWSPSYLVLALLLLCVGLSSAAFHAVAPAIAGKLAGAKLGRGMSFWMTGGEMGRVLGPLVVVTWLRFASLQSMPLLAILGLLLSASLYILLRNMPETHTRHGQGLPVRQAWEHMRPAMLPLIGLLIARSFMSGAVPIFLPTFLTESGSSLWLAGISLTALEAAGVVGTFLSGTFSDWLGRRRIILISTATPPIFLFLFLAVDGWWRLPILLLLGFTLLSITPVLMAVAQESCPENRSLANSVFVSTSFIVRALASVAVGFLADASSLRQGFIISAVIALVGLPLILLLPGKKGT